MNDGIRTWSASAPNNTGSNPGGAGWFIFQVVPQKGTWPFQSGYDRFGCNFKNLTWARIARRSNNNRKVKENV